MKRDSNLCANVQPVRVRIRNVFTHSRHDRFAPLNLYELWHLTYYFGNQIRMRFGKQRMPMGFRSLYSQPRCMLIPCVAAVLLCLSVCTAGFFIFLIVSSSLLSRVVFVLLTLTLAVPVRKFGMQVFMRRYHAHTAHCTCHKYNLHSGSNGSSRQFYEFDCRAAPVRHLLLWIEYGSKCMFGGSVSVSGNEDKARTVQWPLGTRNQRI